MANILIADLREQSAYFLKAFYSGSGHKSIIAVDANRAEAYVKTGVFDILVVDLTVPDFEILEVIKLANDLVPVMPIIAVVSKDNLSNQIEDILFAKISRPIETKRIEQTLNDAINHNEQTCVNKRSDKRADVSLPVLMKIDNTPIPAQGKDLSANGIAIELPGSASIEIGQNISATIQLPDDSLEVTGTVSFLNYKNNLKTIGLQFVSKETIRFKHINSFLSKAS